VGVVVSLTVGEDVQLAEGDQLVFSMDLDSAGQLAVALGRVAIEVGALISAERN